MNQTNKNSCPYCNTENDPFAYNCKNCGAPLPKPADSPYADGGFELGSVDGISGEDVSDYIGMKASAVLPHFFAVDSGRTDWCWPAAIWAFVLGPLGVALWLLWRKVKKVGWLFLLVAVMISVLPLTLYAFHETENAQQVYAAQYEKLKTQYAEKGEQPEEVEMRMAAASQTAVEYVNRYTAFNTNYKIDLVSFLIKILCFIIAGFYGYVWYKNSAIQRIKQFRIKNTDAGYYRFGLVRQGGTSVGAVIIGLAAYFAVNFAAESVLLKCLLM
ncbi:MAG: hypothetical protein MJ132_04670 [Clostridia bacterium]|nr:hypothetical protein [Clostridia bacterium]